MCFLNICKGWRLFSVYLRAVAAAEASLQDGTQLVLDQLLAQRGESVDEHDALQVVELMLHHAGQIAVHPLVVLVEVLVLVVYMDTGGTGHALMDGGDAETALLHRLLLRVLVILHNVRIDISLAETLVFGKVFRKHVQVDHHNTDGKTNRE